eukprot:TRINITY_DN5795_c0_g1_i6.p1 TRINITY_DN5795_c0_g1~~TRINITY_DN5795_c0_g1_i6.p1  ORF type:complete len:384 (+),score=56.03 TRINITY_DN5795_c0_g1_i6:384-1535(+)
MYGHLDKQPPLTDTWAEGLHPYKPVLKDGKLYGRGGADDGYSICAALLSIEGLQKQGIPHGRIVVIIEASEESGSIHLVNYVNFLKDRIGTPNLIVCLDSGCGNYDQFWTTTTLRGLIVVELKVKILNESVHSGSGSGIVPSTFRILRQLLDRLEDSSTGHVKVPELFTEIPEHRLAQAKAAAEILGTSIYETFTFVPGSKPVTEDVYELILNKTWRPTVSVTGVDGIPNLERAGNVLRSYTTLKLSIRLPPLVKSKDAGAAVKKLLEENPPYGAEVTCRIEKSANGWDAPATEPWLETALQKSSNYFCKLPARSLGEGGSIPFMGMLGEMFPQAQFVVTGVLGPESNAHGPNEMLHIRMGKAVTACVASIVSDHFVHHHGNS